jgi:hypothetical protein
MRTEEAERDVAKAEAAAAETEAILRARELRDASREPESEGGPPSSPPSYVCCGGHRRDPPGVLCRAAGEDGLPEGHLSKAKKKISVKKDREGAPAARSALTLEGACR